MQQIILDCATNEAQTVPLTPAQQQEVARAAAAAQQQAQELAAERAWRQQQLLALAGVSAALHDSTAAGDAAALASLVHRLTADPPQPLAAPELSALARFVVRCLLP